MKLGLNTAGLVVAGVDVGSERKGFHAVALQDGRYCTHMAACDVEAVVAWCEELGARAIGIDAPCCWSADGRARTVERELMASDIWCFSTPTLERAEAHPSNHFGWMRNGALLYKALQPVWVLFDGREAKEPTCFETYPQAIACALAGRIVSAKRKATARRALLEAEGIDTAVLTNVDLRDAALCALTADRLMRPGGQTKKFGVVRDGFIVVPEPSAGARVALPA